jgi:hypothetical protein
MARSGLYLPPPPDERSELAKLIDAPARGDFPRPNS